MANELDYDRARKFIKDMYVAYFIFIYILACFQRGTNTENAPIISGSSQKKSSAQYFTSDILNVHNTCLALSIDE